MVLNLLKRELESEARRKKGKMNEGSNDADAFRESDVFNIGSLGVSATDEISSEERKTLMQELKGISLRFTKDLFRRYSRLIQEEIPQKELSLPRETSIKNIASLLEISRITEKGTGAKIGMSGASGVLTLEDGSPTVSPSGGSP